ncbi:MAG: alpha/beta hydrolase [Calditrichales bacterium]|nr:MAG: alpha/beta hydrolase [Calditrichales bacterium]
MNRFTLKVCMSRFVYCTSRQPSGKNPYLSPVFFVLYYFLLSGAAYGQEEFQIWNKGMPNSNGVVVTEIKQNERIYAVNKPTLSAYFPNQENRSKAAVIICPGGGYKHLAIEKEGYQVAKWLNIHGISAFVLKYRLPASPDVRIPYKAPLQDLQRAIKFLHQHKDEWGIDENKIGVLGFSAGGHLAATAGVLAVTDWSLAGDSLDTLKFHPDFMILIYAQLANPSDRLFGEEKSAEANFLRNLTEKVNADTPPTFMVYAADDKTTPPDQGINFYKAMREVNVPAEIHIFESGGHGFGLGKPGNSHRLWPELCINWLRERNIIQGD